MAIAIRREWLLPPEEGKFSFLFGGSFNLEVLSEALLVAIVYFSFSYFLSMHNDLRATYIDMERPPRTSLLHYYLFCDRDAGWKKRFHRMGETPIATLELFGLMYLLPLALGAWGLVSASQL